MKKSFLRVSTEIERITEDMEDQLEIDDLFEVIKDLMFLKDDLQDKVYDYLADLRYQRDKDEREPYYYEEDFTG